MSALLRPRLAPRLAAACLALAWGTLAGSGRVAWPGPAAPEATSVLAAPEATPVLAAPEATPVPAAGVQAAPSRPAAPALPARPAAAPMRTVFPYAPGGDDLLAVEPGAPAAAPTPAGALPSCDEPPSLPPGVHRWAGRCGALQAPRTVHVPWPVQADSVANRWQALQAGVPVLSVRGLGLAPLDPREADSPPALQAAADLRRNGRLAVFALVTVPGDGALAYVVEADERGRWRDLSTSLLGDAAERRFCERPLRVLVADFDADGRPDVFVACEGDRQWLLAGTPRGRLARRALAFTVPATLEAADADGDGRVDLVDAGGWWLPGRGDGRFGSATASGSR